MDALLIDGWLGRRETVRILDEASLAEVRERVARLGAAHDLPKLVLERAKVVATELASNQLLHAARGELAVVPIEREGVAGLELIAADAGPGIGDVTAALERSPSFAPKRASLGVGLGSSRRLSDEMDFDIRIMEGSCVTARLFAAAVPPSREVAILGRPHPEEQVSGDAAAVVRLERALVVAVIDGIGHGVAARESAQTAARLVREHAEEGVLAVLERCHAALDGMRGAVMSVVRLDERSGTAEHAGVGNIVARLCSRERTRTFVSRPLTLGAAGRKLSAVQIDAHAMAPDDVLMLFSDDLSHRTTLDDPAVLHQAPIAIAERLLREHARGRDDALVAVVR